MTYQEFEDEAIRRFGEDKWKWKFVCPVCRHVASVQDWKDAGATDGEVAFSCIGRHIAGSADAFPARGRRSKNFTGPCNYAGGGLFGLNPLEVDGNRYFAFAPAEPQEIAIEIEVPL